MLSATANLIFILGGIWAVVFGEPDAFVGPVIQAPIVEEFTKGIGILLMLLLFKKYIDGPVDGVVFMALIAAGFAFTENILYFTDAAFQGGLGGLTSTFFLRGIMSPFAHVIFSLSMGIIVGLAVAKQWSVGKMLAGWFGAYLVGVLLHGLWNGSSVVANDQSTWFLFYVLVQIPIFIIAAFVVIWLRRREALLTYQILTQYGHVGWFTPPEVETFATWQGRKNIVAWAKRHAPHKKELVEDLTKDVVDLVHVREKIDSGRIGRMVELTTREIELLNHIQVKKQMIVS